MPGANLCLKPPDLPRTQENLLGEAQTFGFLNENADDTQLQTCVLMLSLEKSERSILGFWEEAPPFLPGCFLLPAEELWGTGGLGALGSAP